MDSHSVFFEVPWVKFSFGFIQTEDDFSFQNFFLFELKMAFEIVLTGSKYFYFKVDTECGKFVQQALSIREKSKLTLSYFKAHSGKS